MNETYTLKDLQLAAKLLECAVYGCVEPHLEEPIYMLVDLETAKQCSHAYTLKEWSKHNEAAEVLSYVKNEKVK